MGLEQGNFQFNINKRNEPFSQKTVWDVVPDDTDFTVPTVRSKGMSRRDFLTGGATIGLGLLLSSCSVEFGSGSEQKSEFNLAGMYYAATVEVTSDLGLGTAYIGYDANRRSFGVYTTKHVVAQDIADRNGRTVGFLVDEHRQYTLSIGGFGQNGKDRRTLTKSWRDIDDFGRREDLDHSIVFPLNNGEIDALRAANLVPYYRIYAPNNLQVDRIIASPVYSRPTFSLAKVDRITTQAVEASYLCRDVCSGQSGSVAFICANSPVCDSNSLPVPVVTEKSHSPVVFGEVEAVADPYVDAEGRYCSSLVNISRVSV